MRCFAAFALLRCCLAEPRRASPCLAAPSSCLKPPAFLSPAMDTVDALQLVSSRLQAGEAYAELRRKYVRQIVLNCALKRTAKRRLAKIEYFRKEAIDNYRNFVQWRNAADRVERDFASFSEQMASIARFNARLSATLPRGLGGRASR